MISISHFVPSLALNSLHLDTSRLTPKQSISALVKGGSSNLNIEPTYRKQETKPLQTIVAWGEQTSCTVNQLGFGNKCKITNNGGSAEAWVDQNSNCSTGLAITANLEGPPIGTVKFQAAKGDSVSPLTTFGKIRTVSSWCSPFTLPVTFQIP